MIAIAGFALRGFQMLFGIVALGLSVTLIKGQKIGDAPASLGFTAFAGAITLVGGLIGIAGNWVELLQGALMFGVDGLIALIDIAGGVLLAIKLKGADCSKKDDDYVINKFWSIDLINGGCAKVDGQKICYYGPNGINNRCRQATADSAFLLMTVFVLAASVLVTWFRLKNHK